ncbi:MAG: hypothetical protein R3C39_03115 [Dehalococcoidia bacterium]
MWVTEFLRRSSAQGLVALGAILDTIGFFVLWQVSSASLGGVAPWYLLVLTLVLLFGAYKAFADERGERARREQLVAVGEIHVSGPAATPNLIFAVSDQVGTLFHATVVWRVWAGGERVVRTRDAVIKVIDTWVERPWWRRPRERQQLVARVAREQLSAARPGEGELQPGGAGRADGAHFTWQGSHKPRGTLSAVLTLTTMSPDGLEFEVDLTPYIAGRDREPDSR